MRILNEQGRQLLVGVLHTTAPDEYRQRLAVFCDYLEEFHGVSEQEFRVKLFFQEEEPEILFVADYVSSEDEEDNKVYSLLSDGRTRIYCQPLTRDGISLTCMWNPPGSHSGCFSRADYKIHRSRLPHYGNIMICRGCWDMYKEEADYLEEMTTGGY